MKRQAMPSYRQAPPALVGGALCTDFVNTVSWRGDPNDCGERLTSFDELRVWAVAAGAIEQEEAAATAAALKAHPGKSAAVLADAIALREAIARLLTGGSDSSVAADLATLNGVLQDSPNRTEVVRQGNGFDWRQSEKADPLRRILINVARSAADVLTSDRLERVRTCHDSRCGWLFIDNSRAGKRRWCNMKTCGNRAKARLHYRRSKRTPVVRSWAR